MPETTSTAPVQERRQIPRATAFGVAIGTAPYWILYPFGIFAINMQSLKYGGLLLLMALIVGAGVVALLAIIGLVLAIAERMRRFGGGMIIGAGIGAAVGIIIWSLTFR